MNSRQNGRPPGAGAGKGFREAVGYGFAVHRTLSKPSAQSQEIAEGIVLDYAEDGSLVGIDIDNANRKIDLEEITLSKLPTEGEKMPA